MVNAVNKKRKLLRIIDAENSYIGGICAGIAYRLGVPTLIVRQIFILSTFLLPGLSIFVYGILWQTLPKWDKLPNDFYKVTSDYFEFKKK